LRRSATRRLDPRAFGVSILAPLALDLAPPRLQILDPPLGPG